MRASKKIYHILTLFNFIDTWVLLYDYFPNFFWHPIFHENLFFNFSCFSGEANSNRTKIWRKWLQLYRDEKRRICQKLWYDVFVQDAKDNTSKSDTKIESALCILTKEKHRFLLLFIGKIERSRT